MRVWPGRSHGSAVVGDAASQEGRAEQATPVRGSTMQPWHVHAADLIARGIRGPGWRPPKLTSRQIACACDSRVAIDRSVVMAAVDTPTTSETWPWPA